MFESAQTAPAVRARIDKCWWIRSSTDTSHAVTDGISTASESNPEKDHSRVTFDRVVTASELEALIGELSKLRATMSPAVAYDAPAAASCNPTGSVKPDQATLAMRIDSDGVCRLWLRHEGFGWTVCRLPIEAMMDMQAVFRLALSNVSSGPIFIAFDGSVQPVHADEW